MNHDHCQLSIIVNLKFAMFGDPHSNFKFWGEGCDVIFTSSRELFCKRNTVAARRRPAAGDDERSLLYFTERARHSFAHPAVLHVLVQYQYQVPVLR